MSFPVTLKPQQSWSHRIFWFGVALKGLNALFEMIGGAALLLVRPNSLLSFAVKLTAEELSEDPRDLVANFLLKTAEYMSLGHKTFAALYLLSHGIIKIGLVLALFKQKLWAYPIAIFVFAAFIIYQLYKFSYTHSAILIVLSLFDTVIIFLTWLEFRRLSERS